MVQAVWSYGRCESMLDVDVPVNELDLGVGNGMEGH